MDWSVSTVSLKLKISLNAVGDMCDNKITRKVKRERDDRASVTMEVKKARC